MKPFENEVGMEAPLSRIFSSSQVFRRPSIKSIRIVWTLLRHRSLSLFGTIMTDWEKQPNRPAFLQIFTITITVSLFVLSYNLHRDYGWFWASAKKYFESLSWSISPLPASTGVNSVISAKGTLLSWYLKNLSSTNPVEAREFAYAEIRNYCIYEEREPLFRKFHIDLRSAFEFCELEWGVCLRLQACKQSASTIITPIIIDVNELADRPTPKEASRVSSSFFFLSLPLPPQHRDSRAPFAPDSPV